MFCWKTNKKEFHKNAKICSIHLVLYSSVGKLIRYLIASRRFCGKNVMFEREIISVEKRATTLYYTSLANQTILWGFAKKTCFENEIFDFQVLLIFVYIEKKDSVFQLKLLPVSLQNYWPIQKMWNTLLQDSKERANLSKVCARYFIRLSQCSDIVRPKIVVHRWWGKYCYLG